MRTRTTGARRAGCWTSRAGCASAGARGLADEEDDAWRADLAAARSDLEAGHRDAKRFMAAQAVGAVSLRGVEPAPASLPAPQARPPTLLHLLLTLCSDRLHDPAMAMHRLLFSDDGPAG